MRITWGTKLLLVFVVFAGLISYMVYRCVITPVNLVASEYYNDELAYQQVIDGTKQANALSSPITLQRAGENIMLQLPSEMKHLQVTETVLFYCPSSGTSDRKISLQTDADGQQIINPNLLKRGSYIVKIDWRANNTHYYSEKPFTVL